MAEKHPDPTNDLRLDEPGSPGVDRHEGDSTPTESRSTDERVPPGDKRRTGHKGKSRSARLQEMTIAAQRSEADADLGDALPLAPDVDPRPRKDLALTMKELTDRWSVSYPTARATLEAVGVTQATERRRFHLWSDIFRAEGVDRATISEATRESHPHLFENLLNGHDAARFLGLKSDATIRRWVLSDKFPVGSFVEFGRRRVRRFRPHALRTMRDELLKGRLLK